MPIIKSCCCCRSLRLGCYVASLYTLAYFTMTTVTMARFIDVERRYLSGELEEPESESLLEPSKITPLTVILNVSLLACSLLGLFGSILLIIGVYKNLKYLLIPWIIAMMLDTSVEVVNLFYLGYLQTISFNPITSFLFTMDIFVISLNLYAVVCVISQFQEYQEGRGTAAYDCDDRLAAVQYTARAQYTTTTTSASGRRRSGGRPMPSRFEPEEFSEVPFMLPPALVLSRPSRSNIKKHVQFPDEQSCVEDSDAPPLTVVLPDENPESGAISSLWVEHEAEVPPPDR